MPRFTVLFYGICTNIRHVPGKPHLDRVVLVNGNEANIAYLQSQLGIEPPPQIEPHYASLWVDGSNDVIALDGMVITVEDPVPGLHFPTDLQCVPNLTRMNAKMGKLLGPISPETVLDEDKTRAACYFDFTGGTFTGCASDSGAEGAAMTKVVVETTGAPKLRLRGFRADEITMMIDVPDGGTVWLMNVPENSGDDHEVDFYLHYLAAKNIPNQPATATSISCPAICGKPRKLPKHLQSHLYLMAGAGCSNSNFP